MAYIKRIELKNIRAFKDLVLPTHDKESSLGNRIIIVGKNGTCKTTLLRCIAIGLCDEADGNALLAEPVGNYISEGVSKAKINIELVNSEGNTKPHTISTELEGTNSKNIVSGKRGIEYIPKSLCVCAYGAGRSTIGPETGREYRIADSVYTLFEYEHTLIDPELTLRRLKDYLGSKQYKNTMKEIKRALGLTPKDKIDFAKGGGIELSGPSINAHIRLEGWADGYRMTFSWILDLYAWAMRANAITDNGEIMGILLVDELEQHIHPSMQTDILPKLTELFPKLQIIATTHSPLITLGALPEEVVILRRGEGQDKKWVNVVEEIPDYRGYSVEDMLIDENLFNSQVYSNLMNTKLKEYNKIVSISKSERTKRQTTRLLNLSEEIRRLQIPLIEKDPLIDEIKKLSEKFGL